MPWKLTVKDGWTDIQKNRQAPARNFTGLSVRIVLASSPGPCSPTPMTKLDHAGIGRRLRAIREITRLRDREIALALGVGKTAVNEEMQGRAGLGEEKLCSLAVILGVSFAWLFDGKGRPPSKSRMRTASERLMWSTEDDR